MADFKNFGQKGVASDVQHGKKGGRIKYSANEFFIRDQTDNFYLPVHGGEPTQPTHFTTKNYVDNLVSSQSQNPGFYGIFVGETDESPVFGGIKGLKFNSEDFYVTQNADTDTAIVNFRGVKERDPLVRTAVLDTTASQPIGSPLPTGSRVTTVRLRVLQAYNNSAEISIGDGVTNYMAASENDPEFLETFLSENPANSPVAGTGQVSATVTNAPSTGQAQVTLQYVLPE